MKMNFPIYMRKLSVLGMRENVVDEDQFFQSIRGRYLDLTHDIIEPCFFL